MSLSKQSKRSHQEKHQELQTTTRMSYLDMLPDEMLIKIMKLAVDSVANPFRKHDFLVVLGKTSQRLKRLSEDRSLNKGKLAFSTIVAEIDREATTKEAKELIVKRGKGCAYITEGEISHMAGECPKVEELTIDTFTLTWPDLHRRWRSLRKLVLSWVGKKTFGNEMGDFFVNLAWSVPNLEYIFIRGPSDGGPIYLPEMTGCEKLLEVCLKEGYFDSKKGMCKKAFPFPRGLKILSGQASVLGCDKELLECYFDDCLVSNELKYSFCRRPSLPWSQHKCGV